jgi:hypothetical protein
MISDGAMNGIIAVPAASAISTGATNTARMITAADTASRE